MVLGTCGKNDKYVLWQHVVDVFNRLRLSYFNTGYETTTTTVTGPALAQHAMGLEPSPNVRYYNVYKQDLDNGLHMLRKLSEDHILLNTYSVMKVKLAVNVLSDSTAEAPRQLMGDEASETSKLCETINKFFDCLNVRSVTEHRHKRL